MVSESKRFTVENWICPDPPEFVTPPKNFHRTPPITTHTTATRGGITRIPKSFRLEPQGNPQTPNKHIKITFWSFPAYLTLLVKIEKFRFFFQKIGSIPYLGASRPARLGVLYSCIESPI